MHDIAPARPVATPAVHAPPLTAPSKRALDVVVAAVALVILAPVLAAVALAILVAMGRPVLFRQSRPGLHGRPFELLKFRTMTVAPPDAGTDLDAQRVTRLGQLLRRTSLDELPELVNVLRGEMSLVGPRPLLTAYLDHYTPTQARRHEVRPGITGLAQTEGRKGLSWDDTFALDVWYVDNRSLALDLRIIARTARGLFSDVGATAAEDLTRPDFGAVSTTTIDRVVTIPETPAPPEGTDPAGHGTTSPLHVMEPADLLAWKRARGAHVVEHHDQPWERHHGGFYQPLHLLDRRRLDDVRRPTATAWGYRSALEPADAHAANASIAVRLLPDVAAFDVSSWSSNRRNQLRRCEKRTEVTVLTDPTVLHHHGLRIVRSAAARIGFTPPSPTRYAAELDRYLSGHPLVLLSSTRAGAPTGYLTAYAVGATAYVDRVFVHTDALSTYASIGLTHELLRICQRTPGIREVVHGQDRIENPSLGRFKEGLGFHLVPIPAYLHLSTPIARFIRQRRPASYHRLTGRT